MFWNGLEMKIINAAATTHAKKKKKKKKNQKNQKKKTKKKQNNKTKSTTNVQHLSLIWLLFYAHVSTKPTVIGKWKFHYLKTAEI